MLDVGPWEWAQAVLQICNAVLLSVLNKCLKLAAKLSEIEGSGFCYLRSV